jgi:hypothetical protein
MRAGFVALLLFGLASLAPQPVQAACTQAEKQQIRLWLTCLERTAGNLEQAIQDEARFRDEADVAESRIRNRADDAEARQRDEGDSNIRRDLARVVHFVDKTWRGEATLTWSYSGEVRPVDEFLVLSVFVPANMPGVRSVSMKFAGGGRQQCSRSQGRGYGPRDTEHLSQTCVIVSTLRSVTLVASGQGPDDSEPMGILRGVFIGRPNLVWEVK